MSVNLLCAVTALATVAVLRDMSGGHWQSITWPLTTAVLAYSFIRWLLRS